MVLVNDPLDSGIQERSSHRVFQEVKLCCKACLKDFNKDKAGYLKKIDAEAKKQKK